jgi:hypothetical protein
MKANVLSERKRKARNNTGIKLLVDIFIGIKINRVCKRNWLQILLYSIDAKVILLYLDCLLIAKKLVSVSLLR